MPLESMIRVSGVIEKLRFKTIYSEKDFKSPLIISKEVARLRDIKKNYHSGFIRETSNIFNNYSKTGDPGLIDSSKLVATLFSFRQNHKFYEDRREIEQIEISHTIDSLLGKSKDFITGKKDSSIILPAYLVLRAFKEKNSNWLSLTLGKLSDDSLNTLDDRVNHLKHNLLSSINTPEEKRAVKKVLDYNLDIKLLRLRRKIYSLSFLEKPEEEKRPYLTVKERLGKDKLRVIRSRIEMISATSDSKLLKILKESQRKHEFKDLILVNEIMARTSMGKKGKLVFDRSYLDDRRERLEREKSDDNKYEIDFYKLLDSIFDKKNTDSITTFISLIGSGGKEYFSPILAQPRNEKFYKHVRKITAAYSEVLATTISNKAANKEFVSLLSKSFQNQISGPVNLNFKIVEMLFEKYYDGKLVLNKHQVGEFVKLPGMAEAIFSIRKLLAIDLVRRQFESLNIKDESQFYAQATPYSRDTRSDILKKLANDIRLGEFTEYDEEFIHRLLARLSLEGSLQDRNKYFDENIRIPYAKERDGNITADYPRPVAPGKQRVLESHINGLNIPIISELESDGQKGIRLTTVFKDWPISYVGMSIAK